MRRARGEGGEGGGGVLSLKKGTDCGLTGIEEPWLSQAYMVTIRDTFP